MSALAVIGVWLGADLLLLGYLRRSAKHRW
jgi:hypothetical protein